MILRTISLQIRESGLSPKYAYAFKSASRYICNYVQRNVLKALKYKTDCFDRIVINLCSNPAPQAKVNYFDAACVEIDFPKALIDASTGRELTMLQIDFLKAGIEKCASAYPIPKQEMFRGLDRFVEEGMKNQWLHKTKAFKAEGVVASLGCKMTQELFALRLTLNHLGETVFDDVILETGPDEILFAYKFKDVVIESGNLIVREKSDRHLWERPLMELLRKGRGTVAP